MVPDFKVVVIVGVEMLALCFGFALTQSLDDFESWSAGAKRAINAGGAWKSAGKTAQTGVAE